MFKRYVLLVVMGECNISNDLHNSMSFIVNCWLSTEDTKSQNLKCQSSNAKMNGYNLVNSLPIHCLPNYNIVFNSSTTFESFNVTNKQY